MSPTIDAVKSRLHTTEVFRFITQPDYAPSMRAAGLSKSSDSVLFIPALFTYVLAS
jgi:hypothetical protein